MKEKKQIVPLNILLADDDVDDRFFFAKAVEDLSCKIKLTTVHDGEKLLAYLLKNSDKPPYALFLDLNMPCKNGNECLVEIKANKKIADFPVIIYSTSLNDEVADVLHRNGACFYMQKCNVAELTIQLEHVLKMLAEKDFKRPTRSKFILTLKQIK